MGGDARAHSLDPLSLERMLANLLNRLESYITRYNVQGFNAIEKDYYKYWMHRFVL